jgi:hypothetical protein
MCSQSQREAHTTTIAVRTASVIRTAMNHGGTDGILLRHAQRGPSSIFAVSSEIDRGRRLDPATTTCSRSQMCCRGD